MKFSKRTQWAAEPNTLSELLARKREAGEPLWDLSESNPTRCGFSSLGEHYLNDFTQEQNKLYEPNPQGLLEARKAIASYYAERGYAILPEQIFLTAGTSEAYSFLFRLLTDPGDSVAVPRPSYPLFDFLADLNDLKIQKYPLSYKDGRWDSPRDFKSCGFAPDPRLLIFVNPNNPTGNFLHPREIDAAVEWCRAHEAALISDEVFFDFPIKGETLRRSLVAENRVLSFTLSGISKVLGLPQMKLSWIVVSGPEPARSQAMEKLEILADTYLSVSTPVQRALPSWLGQSKAVAREILQRLQNNLTMLRQTVSGMAGVSLFQPEGGWYALLKGELIQDDEALCVELLQKDHTVVHPGYFFDFPSEGMLVISLLPPENIFKEGVARLSSHLGKMKSK